MKLKIFIAAVLLSCAACKNDGETIKKMAFEATKWKATDQDSIFLYRDKMLQDLMQNRQLKGLSENEVLELLGKPTRTDGLYLFYRISEEKAGLLTLHAKTLVLKLAADHKVESVLLHK